MTKLIKQPIGIIISEGAGAEIIDSVLKVLREIEKVKQIKFGFVEYKGPLPSAIKYGEDVQKELTKFYREIKEKNGCIIRSGIYARTVYQLRKDFNLVYKPTYFKPILELLDTSLLKSEIAEKIDVLLIRENSQGLLFSEEEIKKTKTGEKILYGTFAYEENKIRALAKLAFEQAQKRRKILELFIKGDVWRKLLPLWFDAFESVGKNYPEVKFDWEHADIGLAEVLMKPARHDVIVTLGIVGDTIVDVYAALLYGTRAATPTANISPDGFMTFQTIHGACTEIAGQNKVNPVGQIRSAAMMLDLFFKMPKEAELIEDAIRKVLSQGYRTIDIYRSNNPNHRLIGTKEMTELIVKEIRKLGK